jgi:hypothetical protein
MFRSRWEVTNGNPQGTKLGFSDSLRGLLPTGQEAVDPE